MEIALYSYQILIDLLCREGFSKNLQIPNLMKIHTVEAKLFHAD
jgi:hypothetical protein